MKKKRNKKTEENFFKLINNSTYSQIVENLRKKDVRLVNNEKGYLKYASKPTFTSKKFFNKNIAVTHKSKSFLVLNKSIYVGFTVPEMRKHLLYGFHYNFIKKKFDAELLFTDTGSLTYEIKREDVYEKFFKDKHLFVFSEYQSKVFDSTNKKAQGKIKDEYKGIPFNKLIGIKSNGLYSV